jgi:enamine deaminase RidA (YjgF/YER057c/UK114 family)
VTFCTLSGLTDESGEDHDTYQQTVVTLSELDRYLRHYGSNRERLLRVEIWLADIKDFDAMNRAWIEWLGNSPRPARACVQAGLAGLALSRRNHGHSSMLNQALPLSTV